MVDAPDILEATNFVLNGAIVKWLDVNPDKGTYKSHSGHMRIQARARPASPHPRPAFHMRSRRSDRMRASGVASRASQGEQRRVYFKRRVEDLIRSVADAAFDDAVADYLARESKIHKEALVFALVTRKPAGGDELTRYFLAGSPREQQMWETGVEAILTGKAVRRAPHAAPRTTLGQQSLDRVSHPRIRPTTCQHPRARAPVPPRRHQGRNPELIAAMRNQVSSPKELRRHTTPPPPPASSPQRAPEPLEAGAACW